MSSSRNHGWRQRLAIAAAICIAAVGCTGSASPSPTGLSSTAPTGSPSATASGPIELLMWSYLTASDGAAWQKMIDDFNNAHKDQGVSVNMLVLDHDQYNTKIVSGVATGGLVPDFGWGTGGRDAQWAKDGVLVPLDDLAAKVGLDLADFYPAALQSAKYPRVSDSLYMIPMDAMDMANLINVDDATAAGLDVSKPPTTGEEFIRWAQALTTYEGGNVDRAGIVAESPATPLWMWGIVSAQYGFKRASDDLKTACVNPDAGKQALQWIVDLYDKYKVASRDVSDSYKQWGTGQGSMFWIGPWTIQGWLDQKINFIAAPLPLIGTEPHNFAEIGGLEIFKQTDESRYQATMDAIKWLSDNSFPWNTAGRGGAVRQSIAKMPNYETAGFDPKYRKAFIDDLEHADVGPVPVTSSTDFHIYAGSNKPAIAMGEVLAGSRTVDAFMTDICAVWQADLDAE